MSGKRQSQGSFLGTKAAPLALLALACCAGVARGQLHVARHAIAGGGITVGTGAALTLGATIGQHDAGTLGSGPLILQGGFWLGGAAVSGVASPTAPGGPDAPGAPVVALRLIAGVPNPFLSSTQALLDLPQAQRVRVSVYDHAGRLVRRLCDQILPAGHHQIPWNGRGLTGERVASGIYLMRIETESKHVARNLVLLGR